MGRSDPGRAGSRPWRSGSAGFYLKYSFVARAETFYNYGGPRPGPGRTQTLIKMVGWWGCGRGPVSLLIDWQLSVCSIHCVQARSQAAEPDDMCWSRLEMYFLQLLTNLCEVLLCPEKAFTKAFLLKAFTIQSLRGWRCTLCSIWACPCHKFSNWTLWLELVGRFISTIR